MTARSRCCGQPVIGNRCATRKGCGHRQPVNGREPIETRYFPPPIWVIEICQRRKARKAGQS